MELIILQSGFYNNLNGATLQGTTYKARGGVFGGGAAVLVAL
jgi:hypothetical protein